MPRPPFGLPHLCIDSHLCRCICASTAICAVASVHRQPFVPLHRATALCGCLYASLHNGFVRPLSCILCTFMNALWALRPCKAFGRSFYKASVPYPQVAGSRTRRTKNNTPLIELAKVWRGCRIVLALLVSHRAKLWASTITHPCVCGRLGRCIVQRLCATAIVHPCTTRKLRVLAPAAPKIIPRSLSWRKCGGVVELRSFGSLHRAATLCDRYRASLHDPHSASSPPSTKKSRAMPV